MNDLYVKAIFDFPWFLHDVFLEDSNFPDFSFEMFLNETFLEEYQFPDFGLLEESTNESFACCYLEDLKYATDSLEQDVFEVKSVNSYSPQHQFLVVAEAKQPIRKNWDFSTLLHSSPFVTPALFVAIHARVIALGFERRIWMVAWNLRTSSFQEGEVDMVRVYAKQEAKTSLTQVGRVGYFEEL